MHCVPTMFLSHWYINSIFSSLQLQALANQFCVLHIHSIQFCHLMNFMRIWCKVFITSVLLKRIFKADGSHQFIGSHNLFTADSKTNFIHYQLIAHYTSSTVYYTESTLNHPLSTADSRVLHLLSTADSTVLHPHYLLLIAQYFIHYLLLIAKYFIYNLLLTAQYHNTSSTIYCWLHTI